MKTIATDRLILRAWTPDDAPAMFDYAKSPLVGPAAGWKPHNSIEETREFPVGTVSSGVLMSGSVREYLLSALNLVLHPREIFPPS